MNKPSIRVTLFDRKGEKIALRKGKDKESVWFRIAKDLAREAAKRQHEGSR